MSLPGVRQLWSGFNHTPPSSIKFKKKEFSYTSIPYLCLHGMLLGKIYDFEYILMSGQVMIRKAHEYMYNTTMTYIWEYSKVPRVRCLPLFLVSAVSF
jgi:hypothetical protein